MQTSGRKLLTWLCLSATIVSAGERRASAIVTPEPPLTTHQPTTRTRSAKAIQGDAGQLTRCLQACEAGGRTLTNFCNSIPDPKIARGCHALELGSEVACKGFCYCYWGT